MKTISFIFALTAVFAQAPAPPAMHPPSCFVYEGHRGSDAIVTRSFRIYECETATTLARVAVERDWFKAHCRRVDRLSSAAAECDAYAPNVSRVEHPAAPSKVKDRLETIGYFAIGAVVITACVLGGGCGWLGGS